MHKARATLPKAKKGKRVKVLANTSRSGASDWSSMSAPMSCCRAAPPKKGKILMRPVAVPAYSAGRASLPMVNMMATPPIVLVASAKKYTANNMFGNFGRTKGRGKVRINVAMDKAITTLRWEPTR